MRVSMEGGGKVGLSGIKEQMSLNLSYNSPLAKPPAVGLSQWPAVSSPFHAHKHKTNQNIIFQSHF